MTFQCRPLDRAVWWLEFVMRHPRHLHPRSPVHDLSWHQFLLLDVVAFVGAVSALAVLVVVKVVSWCCCGRGGSTKRAARGGGHTDKSDKRKKRD